MKRVARKWNNAGFSLVEVAAAICVAGVGLPAVAYLYAASMTVSSDAELSGRAFFLANSLMNEISERRFRENAANPGNGVDDGEVNGFDRTNFDDIDDYNIFNSTWGPLSAPRDRSGMQLTDYAQFSQWVEVVNIAPPTSDPERDLSPVSAGSTDFKKVTVRVSWDTGKRSMTVTKLFVLP